MVHVLYFLEEFSIKKAVKLLKNTQFTGSQSMHEVG